MQLRTAARKRADEQNRHLRRAVTPLLPREVIAGKKRGFSPPIGNWLRNELQPLTREVLSPAALRQQGYFRPDAVSLLIDEHAARKADNSRKIWALLTFSLWLDRYATAGQATPSDGLLAEV